MPNAEAVSRKSAGALWNAIPNIRIRIAVPAFSLPKRSDIVAVEDEAERITRDEIQSIFASDLKAPDRLWNASVGASSRVIPFRAVA